MKPQEHNKKRPLWKWILLFIAAFVLSTMGYALAMIGFEVGDHLGHPSWTIVTVVATLGLYALFVRLMEKHWPTDLSLRKLVPHTPCWACSWALSSWRLW